MDNQDNNQQDNLKQESVNQTGQSTEQSRVQADAGETIREDAGYQHESFQTASDNLNQGQCQENQGQGWNNPNPSYQGQASQYQNNQGAWQGGPNPNQANSNNFNQGQAFVKGPLGEIRSPLTVMLLTLVTCGIYGVIWHYKVSEEINNYTRSNLTEPNYAIIGLFCFIFSFINWSKIDQAIMQINHVEGRSSDSKFLAWLLISLFAGFGSLLMVYQVQDDLNKIWLANGAQGPGMTY